MADNPERNELRDFLAQLSERLQPPTQNILKLHKELSRSIPPPQDEFIESSVGAIQNYCLKLLALIEDLQKLGWRDLEIKYSDHTKWIGQSNGPFPVESLVFSLFVAEVNNELRNEIHGICGFASILIEETKKFKELPNGLVLEINKQSQILLNGVGDVVEHYRHSMD